jgi:hypothetical protein
MIIGAILWISASVCTFVFACCRLPKIEEAEQKKLEGKKESALPSAVASITEVERGDMEMAPTPIVNAKAIPEDNVVDNDSSSDPSLTEAEILEIKRLKKEKKRRKKEAAAKKRKEEEERMHANNFSEAEIDIPQSVELDANNDEKKKKKKKKKKKVEPEIIDDDYDA